MFLWLRHRTGNLDTWGPFLVLPQASLVNLMRSLTSLAMEGGHIPDLSARRLFLKVYGFLHISKALRDLVEGAVEVRSLIRIVSKLTFSFIVAQRKGNTTSKQLATSAVCREFLPIKCKILIPFLTLSSTFLLKWCHLVQRKVLLIELSRKIFPW